MTLRGSGEGPRFLGEFTKSRKRAAVKRGPSISPRIWPLNAMRVRGRGLVSHMICQILLRLALDIVITQVLGKTTYPKS